MKKINREELSFVNGAFKKAFKSIAIVILIAILAIMMTSCKKVAVSSSTEGNQVQVDLIFVKDDVKMYRFEDNGRYHYFTSRGETMTTQSEGSGKNETHYEENIQQDMKKKIYLDDVRTPVDPTWTVVRNYEQFVHTVTWIGLENIDVISLDHDLGDSAMAEWHKNVYHNYELNYDNITEKTGMDCTKWLVNQWLDGAPVVDVVIHSANAVGSGNMMGYINNYRHIHRLPQNCVRVQIEHTVQIMTLKEKFGELYIEKGMSFECEKIAEEFAIGFAKWLDNKYYQGKNVNEYHRSIDEYREGKYFTAKELLEIYKKEKGL